MINKEKSNSFGSEAIPSTGTGSNLEMAASPEAGPRDAHPYVQIAIEKPEAAQRIEQQVVNDGSPSSPVDREPPTDETIVAIKQAMIELPDHGPDDTKSTVPVAMEKIDIVEAIGQQADADESSTPSVEPVARTNEVVPPIAVEPVSAKRPKSFFGERPDPIIEMAPRVLRYRTRRNLLFFGAGAVAAVAGAGALLPQATLGRLGVRRNINARGKEWLLNKALRIDDDVAEALYSRNRMVPTYTKSQITPIKNNYNGATPDPGYISGWNLTLEGLASGLRISLDIRKLVNRFAMREQITRFVCVEGWSAIAWWAGLRFDDLLRAYSPKSQAKWALVESSVNLDASGNPDPYFASIL